jgi:FkbM family methyltransferase
MRSDQELLARPVAPVVSTRRLFATLLRYLSLDTVCDIGSMDGSDALRFRRQSPVATVIAFEANPRNFERMRNDLALGAANIHCEPLAVSDTDGSADFFVVRAYWPEVRVRRGMSSLYQRREADQLEAVVHVQTVRLDTYLAQNAPHATRVALWIDVEGKAFEVISGASEALGKVQLLHVEVETTPLIADSQKTYSDVYAFLESAGFEEIATDHPAHGSQFNTLWMRMRQSEAVLRAVRRALVRARLRRYVTDIVHRLLSARACHYLAGRFGVRGSIP